jgi:hypothetical protein
MNDSQIEFACEFCGASIAFPAFESGCVEVCPECAEYIEVPLTHADDVGSGGERVAVDVPETVNIGDYELRFEVEFGLPHPLWDEFHASIPEDASDTELCEAYDQAAHCWLDHLTRCLQSGHVVSESNEFLLLSHQSVDDPVFFLDYCNDVWSRISEIVRIPQCEDGYARFAVLCFNDAESYYDYVCHFHPDGDYGGSSGMFIRSGYSHIVAYHSPELRHVIAHELTHAYLSHLPLPSWLDEGITQTVEDLLTERSWFHPSVERLAEMSRYCRKNGLQWFWTGEGFSLPDDGQEFSYTLARLLVLRLSTDHNKQFWMFVEKADWTDAGDAALRDAIGVSLADLVGTFFGPGDWTPQTIADPTSEEPGQSSI